MPCANWFRGEMSRIRRLIGSRGPSSNRSAEKLSENENFYHGTIMHLFVWLCFVYLNVNAGEDNIDFFLGCFSREATPGY